MGVQHYSICKNYGFLYWWFLAQEGAFEFGEILLLCINVHCYCKQQNADNRKFFHNNLLYFISCGFMSYCYYKQKNSS